MVFDWSEEKNDWLKKERSICFEDVFEQISQGLFVEIPHPNQEKYPHQNAYIVKINNYPHLIPFVEKENIRFLKTIIPSRKLQKQYPFL